jgi:CRP/FNR family transcriptional regulator, cyclic AMP receptor protein
VTISRQLLKIIEQALTHNLRSSPFTSRRPIISSRRRTLNDEAIITSALQKSRWFSDLDAEQQLRVRTALIFRDYDADAFVLRKGERVDSWVGVIEGMVKINAGNSQGKSATFTGVPAGGWLGEGSLLKTETRRYDVVALRKSRVAFLPKRTFLELLNESIPFNRYLLEQLNERLGQFIGMIESERLLGSNARVARCIAALFNPSLYPNSSNELSITQEEIGFLSGLSRQRTNAALSYLQSLGLIRVKYRAVEVLDLSGLHTVG